MATFRISQAHIPTTLTAFENGSQLGRVSDAGSATVMEKPTASAAMSSEGFLVLDSSMNPIFVNQAAARILLHPQAVEKQRKLNDLLASKIRCTLWSGGSSSARGLVTKFQSGRRLYLCRAFRVHALADSQPSVAVLLERGSAGSISLIQVSETFHLTTREQEVLQHLLEGGLTSKEIAARMGISPNTVKAFLRLIMLKMGVSTRSGIVGKAITTKTLSRRHRDEDSEPSKASDSV
jgi:DNA-binding CsgD family transcriptional regulator